MCRTGAVLLLFALLVIAAPPAYPESWPAGEYVRVGKLVLLEGDRVGFLNGRITIGFDLKDPADLAALRKDEGKWVRAEFTQTNRAGPGRPPVIKDIKLTVLHDAKNPFPLIVQASPTRTRIAFGETFSFSCRLANDSGKRIDFVFCHVFPYLTAKNEDGYEVALRAPSNRPGYPGLWLEQKILEPRAELKTDMTCTNLIQPGRYVFRVVAPEVGGIKVLSDPVEIEVVSPSREATKKTLLEWMDKATFPQRKGIAWMLWRDFDNHDGMKKLIEIMDGQERPHQYTAGIIAAAEGKAAIEPFLRAIRKEKKGGRIHYWCERACQSPERLAIFKRLLREDTRIPHGKAGDRPVPLSQLVAQFLVYYREKDDRFTWKESDEHRVRIVQELRKLLDESPGSIRLFDGEHDFDPESIDALMRRKLLYWGSD
jgi:hypothetical protein